MSKAFPSKNLAGIFSDEWWFSHLSCKERENTRAAICVCIFKEQSSSRARRTAKLFRVLDLIQLTADILKIDEVTNFHIHMLTYFLAQREHFEIRLGVTDCPRKISCVMLMNWYANRFFVTVSETSTSHDANFSFLPRSICTLSGKLFPFLSIQGAFLSPEWSENSRCGSEVASPPDDHIDEEQYGTINDKFELAH
jgi:hypothetical protein